MNGPEKPIRFTNHAKEQCQERGTNEEEVREAILRGVAEAAKRERIIYRYNLHYNTSWQGKQYAVKQVVPVVAEEENEFVVITVYTFYF